MEPVNKATVTQTRTHTYTRIVNRSTDSVCVGLLFPLERYIKKLYAFKEPCHINKQIIKSCSTCPIFFLSPSVQDTINNNSFGKKDTWKESNSSSPHITGVSVCVCVRRGCVSVCVVCVFLCQHLHAFTMIHSLNNLCMLLSLTMGIS